MISAAKAGNNAICWDLAGYANCSGAFFRASVSLLTCVAETTVAAASKSGKIETVIFRMDHFFIDVLHAR
jgi:hypothetical protein